LKLLKVRVYFDNNRTRTTVKKDQAGLVAYADIDFKGSGPVRGYWQLDGRRHAPVKIDLKRGRRVTIETPAQVPLPTDKTGSHRIRLIITTPPQKRSFPGAVYTVTQVLAKESPMYDSSLKEEAVFVPKQVLVVAKAAPENERLFSDLGKKYDLRLMEAYDIKSLGLRMAVFYTDQDVLKKVTALKQEQGVISAQPNFIFRTMTEPMSDMQNVYKQLNLGKLHKRCTGKNVKVAVVDTGVDTGHRDLKDRVVGCINFVRGSDYKGELHGTAVAGVIGASMNGYGIAGVAPESRILALRACRQVSDENPKGECSTASISRALDTAIEKEARVVNMSFGAESSDSLLHLLIKEGAKRRIVFVAPAGNRMDQKRLWFPASHPDVVAVAGIDDKGHEWPNAEIASQARVCASTEKVFTTVPGNRHNFMGGTSMASAVVAGIMALAIEKNRPVRIDKIPVFKENICNWAEKMVDIPICEK
jgi:subtilisin family serine protease